jgi:hypothetical protein
VKNMLKLAVALVLLTSAVVSVRAEDPSGVCGTCGCDNIPFSPYSHDPICEPEGGTPPAYYRCTSFIGGAHYCSEFL